MKITAFLAEEIANILGLPLDTVIGSDFDDLGLTSVNMTEIVGILSLTFPQLPITILYEYKNLEALVHFLQANYSEIVAEKFAEIIPNSNQNKTDTDQARATDIAIIGMSGYFPGATNIEAFWELLLAGSTAFSEVPIERWNMDEFYNSDETKSGYSYSKWGAFLKDIDKFDPLLFNISPRDAAKIDPQERLFLQASYTALEDSGYISLLNEATPEKVGVYVGVTNASYGWLENDHEQWRQIKHVNVSSAYWSVANRVSYTFNFTGPSLSIDTACSSSLTALHLACNSLINGECTYSIVGGVNLILHPRQYTELSEMKMLSRGNQNKTFSQAADGFVYGEGVIALVLKPLQKAIEDHDRIYAVIKSTSINANGKTSGYTVPSPNAQAMLISDAIDKSGFSAAEIQYVECHGTGTKLGDPIEIRGLTKAFEDTTSEKQFCMLGSVKTNIGHLESAAGLAGIVKAALQIANKRIAPSVLVEPLNKAIDFNNSPFKLVKESQPWPKENAALVTCVSSFGAGGANAHAILSNRPVQLIKQTKEKNSYLLGISANHPIALRQKLEELCSWLKSKATDRDLEDMVYTLNNHRLHYSQRMAFIFHDKETLEKQLLDVIVNEIPLNYYSNSIVEHQPQQKFSQAELNLLIDNNPSDETLHHLGIGYVNGVNIDWNTLYKAECYQAIKAPTYPFLKERCWISDEFLNKVESLVKTHHSFISEYNLDQQYCSKTFDADHYAFAEHVLRGEKIFPGVCHLKMVHAAYTKLYQANVGVISEITWLAPMNLNDERCEAKLVFSDNGSVTSYQLGKFVKGEFLLCSQGKISSDKKDSTRFDISSYQDNLTEKMDGSELYTFFRDKGWYHGPAFQSVNQLYFNDEMLVAEIQSPHVFNNPNENYGLNPGIMDGILQAITILNMRVLTKGSIALPFYLQSLELIKPLPEKVYALVTIVESKGKNRSKFYNVAVTDLENSLCLKLSGFTMALIQEKSGQNDIQFFSYKSHHASMFDKQRSDPASKCRIVIVENQNDSHRYAKSSDVVIELREKRLRLDGHSQPFNIDVLEECLTLIQNLKRKGEDIHLVNLVDIGGAGNTGLSQFVQIYIGFIQLLLKERIPLRFIFSCEFSRRHPECNEGSPVANSWGSLAALGMTGEKLHDDNFGSLGACMPGFYKSLHAEQPSVNACHLKIAKHDRNSTDLKEKIAVVLDHHYHCPELFFSDVGLNYVQLTPTKPVKDQFHFKNGATYLIAGGLGGIGRQLTLYLTKNYEAKVILLGRSALNNESEQFLDACKSVYYYPVDICNQADLAACYQNIKLTFPKIDGVFNLVALSNDDYFIQKDLTAFTATCATKIEGTLNLDRLLAEEPLEFFVLFSSISAVLGNRGQTDYAAANAWFYQFSGDRNHYVENNLRHGVTVSICWPYITGGGFQLDTVYLNWMKEHWGMLPLTTDQCIEAILAAISCGASQIMPFIGNQEQLINYYNKTCLPAEVLVSEKIGAEPSLNHQHNRVKLEQELKALIATHQKIKPEDLDVETDLTEFGYNSISFTELSTLINEQFTISITPAIFFDATCISELAELLIEDYPDVFAINDANEPLVKEQEVNVQLKGANDFDEPIAIIGYHARFPGAKSAEEYWANLTSGTCSITEIPAERWRWQDVYGNPEDGDFTRSKWGGFIEDLDKFDARFFGISPREAELMDPQQRIFLQSVYHAMEHSGYNRQSFAAQKTGLYVGVSLFEYGKLLQLYADIDAYTSSGTVHSIVANRVSYIMGLTGPSIALDTACSSSLVAVHEAVKALRYGDCELAIAGGVNALIEPSFYIAFDKAGMLSPDGICKTFDKSANGYVRGEGVATLILKPLNKALQDKDTIYGLVKETGINHGGHAQTMTSPNPTAQAELIIDTFQKAKIPFNTVQYIECHGTGTPLGDPVEVNGLKKAYKVLKEHNIELENEAQCGIGSVKTNIGHLESSSGVAGIVKVLLMMQNKKLVKTLNFSQLNPYIDISNSPFYVVNENKPWLENKTKSGQILPLRAAVSGFGFGGANAHVILEMPPENIHEESKKAKPFYLITLSAGQEEILQQKIQELALWLEKQNCSQHDAIESISFTLNQGREHFKYKFACITTNQQDLLKILTGYMTKGTHNAYATVFVGSGSAQSKPGFNDIYERLLAHRFEQQVYKELLISLAQNYVAGGKIDWIQLHREEVNYRIALPHYPFEKKPYWFTKKVNNSQPLAELSHADTHLNQYCFTTQWEKFSPQLGVTSVDNKSKLVVYFDQEVQAAFQTSFPADVEQFVIHDEGKNDLNSCYCIDKQDVFSYMDALSSVGKMELIYFICPQKSFEDDLSNEYLTIFFRFIKSMLHANYEHRAITIKMITFGITNPTGDKHKLAASSGIQGFAKTLANEFLDWRIEQFDLSMDTIQLPEVIHHFLNTSGHLCLYRNGEWYRQRLVQQNLMQPLQRAALKKMGTYLIIGGMGGIGRVLADYLTINYNANVLLVGRRSPQEIDEKYRHQYLQYDISQEQSVLALYEHLQNSHLKIDGLFHCAMVLKDQLIRQMSENNLAKVIKPKSCGTYHLLNIMGDSVQDFIAIFSSTESYFALQGQSNYTAASWLQDQIAEEFYRQQKKIKLIHWGLWEEAGAVADEHYQKALYKLGFVGIKNKDAMKLLEVALINSDFDVALLGINEHARTIYPILNLKNAVESTTSGYCTDSLREFDDFLLHRMGDTPSAKNRQILSRNQHINHSRYDSTAFFRLNGNYSPKEVRHVSLPMFATKGEDPRDGGRSDVFKEMKQQQDVYFLVNEIALNLLWAAFNHMNLWTDFNQVVTYQQLFNVTNSSKQSANLLTACLTFLNKYQYISYEATTNSYISKGNKTQSLVQAIQETTHTIGLYPALKPFLEVLIQTTTHLFEILNGRMTATEVLCPDGALSLLSSLYSNNAIVNPINLLVAKKVEGLVRAKLASSKEIRILEIGAGCGGTTSCVLELLKDKSAYIKYTFTDISPAFINRAKAHFSEYANIEFQLLDIESTNLNHGTFDLLLASNVLHATKDIQLTLRACKSLLHPNGSFIINEVTQDQPFLTLIFGLFPGWWTFQDSFRMPNSPLLSAESWRLQLSHLGFEDIEITHTTLSDPHTLIHAVNKQKVMRSAHIASSPCGANISQELRTNNPSSALRAPSPHAWGEGKNEGSSLGELIENSLKNDDSKYEKIVSCHNRRVNQQSETMA